MTEQLELADFLLVAEAVLAIEASGLIAVTQIPLAESALAAPFASFGGIDFYPDPAERGAIVCSRIVRNHPLPDGNKRVAYLCMREQLHRAGLSWAGLDPDEQADAVEALAARDLTEPEFILWVQRNCS